LAEIVKEMNTRKDVKVFIVLLGNRTDKAKDTLSKIAADNNGQLLAASR